MKKSFKKQIDNIKREIGVMANEFSYELSKQAEIDMINAHKQIIDNFYSAHDPKTYNRKEGLYNSIIPQGVNHGENSRSYEASVKIGSFRMDDHYRANPDIVFDLMWNRGVRGLPKRGTERILDKSYIWGLGKNKTYYNYGENPRYWENPFWSSTEDPYHNKFITVITMNGKTTSAGVPNQVMYEFVNNWDKFSGKISCKNIANKIKNKYSNKT